MKRLAKIQIIMLFICLLFKCIPVYASTNEEKWLELLEDWENEDDSLSNASPSNATPRGNLLGDCSVNCTGLGSGKIAMNIISSCKVYCDSMNHAMALQKYDSSSGEYEEVARYAFADYKLSPGGITTSSMIVDNLEPGKYRVRGLHSYYLDDEFEVYNSKTNPITITGTPTSSSLASVYYNTNLVGHDTPETQHMRILLTNRGFLTNVNFNPSALTLLESIKKEKVVHYLGHGWPGRIDNQFAKLSGNEILANVVESPIDFIYLEACFTATPDPEHKLGDVDDALYQVGAGATLAFGTRVEASSLTDGIHFYSMTLFDLIFTDGYNMVDAAQEALNATYEKYEYYFGADSYETHGNYTYSKN